MTLWQKLANLNDVIGAINLFSVKIDKKKLQSGNYKRIIGVFEKFRKNLKKLLISQNGGHHDGYLPKCAYSHFGKRAVAVLTN